METIFRFYFINFQQGEKIDVNNNVCRLSFGFGFAIFVCVLSQAGLKLEDIAISNYPRPATYLSKINCTL